MHFAIEVLPLVLHIGIAFQFRIALGISETHLLIDGDKVGEKQSIGAFFLIVRSHSHEKQVKVVRAFPEERFSEVPPSEGEEFAFRLLQGHGE